jgi:S-adenosyl-L-methionine hydrolase (adenosine-forming)
MRSIITLTTDFGTGSPYVAQMKGVILSICREVDIVDLSHAIRPQDVREGALALADATPRFPPGSIHVVVVDPGVGTSRRILYAEIGEQRYLAPDNGLLSRLVSTAQTPLLISLENPAFWLPEPSPTFHGRDILAPVAAHLARGLDPCELGPSRETLVLLDWPQPQRSADRITGEVLLVDSFGNLITNLCRADVAALGNPASLTIDYGGRQICGIVPTYSAALSGELVALFDSQDRLEIAKVGGNAALDLRIEPGESVTVIQR